MPRAINVGALTTKESVRFPHLEISGSFLLRDLYRKEERMEGC